MRSSVEQSIPLKLLHLRTTHTGLGSLSRGQETPNRQKTAKIRCQGLTADSHPHLTLLRVYLCSESQAQVYNPNRTEHVY